MRLLLATIERTGTRFFASLLAPVFGAPRVAGTNYYPAVADGPQFLVTHVQNSELIDRYVDEFKPAVVTTIRNLDTLRASYVRRLRNDLNQYLEDWLDFVGRHNPLVVSMDSADRDARLKKLSALVGAELTTDWKPVLVWGE